MVVYVPLKKGIKVDNMEELLALMIITVFLLVFILISVALVLWIRCDIKIERMRKEFIEFYERNHSK